MCLLTLTKPTHYKILTDFRSLPFLITSYSGQYILFSLSSFHHWANRVNNANYPPSFFRYNSIFLRSFVFNLNKWLNVIITVVCVMLVRLETPNLRSSIPVTCKTIEYYWWNSTRPCFLTCIEAHIVTRVLGQPCGQNATWILGHSPYSWHPYTTLYYFPSCELNQIDSSW